MKALSRNDFVSRKLPKIKRAKIVPLKKGLTLKKIVGFDTETTGNYDSVKGDSLLSIQIHDGEDGKIFYAPETIERGMDALDLFPNNSIVFAHNLEFDLGSLLGSENLLNLIEDNESGDWKGSVALGTSSWARIKKKKNALWFIDTKNFFKHSLARASEIYFPDLPKLKKPSWLGLRRPKEHELDSFSDYAIRDAHIAYLLGRKIMELHEIDDVNISLTPAMMAGKLFRKSFMNDPLILERKNAPFLYNCYHGAVFSSFGRGKFENIRYYDINSLYPFSAIESPLNFSNQRLTELKETDLERGFTGWIQGWFKFPENIKYPNLPCRPKVMNKLIFPLSGFTCCTSQEYLSALKQGAEFSKTRSFGFYPEELDINHPLGEFMRELYKRKQGIDHILASTPSPREEQKLLDERLYIKLMVNSLIGKFGQKILKENKELVAGVMFRPDMAASILGHARDTVFKYIREFEPVYTDTDSFVVSKSIDDDLIGEKIGQLKDEINGKANVVLIRSKLYFIERDNNMIKSARQAIGIPGKKAWDLLNDTNLLKIPYKRHRMVRLKESKRRQLKARTFIDQTFTFNLKEDGKRIYDKELKSSDDLLNDSTLSRPLDLLR